MGQTMDCVVAGSCVLDVLCRPVALTEPVGAGVLHAVEPLQVAAGGITFNAGVTMARMGLNVALLSYVGRDLWGKVLRDIARRERLDAGALIDHPTGATSTTVVAIAGDGSGERSFFHCVGAPRLMGPSVLLDRLDFLARSRWLLVGYYGLMPALEPELADVLRRVRAAGCRTAMDAAGDGGTMQPLDRILPHLDVYVPSLTEARHQTGRDDPRRIVETYRECGAPGLLGVKLGGTRGVLLSPGPGQFCEIPSCRPPGPVVDTTGAGDCFQGGLLSGLLKGLSLEQAGRLGAAAAACCVTSLGGSTGGQSYAATSRLAGIGPATA